MTTIRVALMRYGANLRRAGKLMLDRGYIADFRKGSRNGEPLPFLVAAATGLTGEQYPEAQPTEARRDPCGFGSGSAILAFNPLLLSGSRKELEDSTFSLTFDCSRELESLAAVSHVGSLLRVLGVRVFSNYVVIHPMKGVQGKSVEANHPIQICRRNQEGWS